MAVPNQLKIGNSRGWIPREDIRIETRHDTRLIQQNFQQQNAFQYHTPQVPLRQGHKNLKTIKHGRGNTEINLLKKSLSGEKKRLITPLLDKIRQRKSNSQYSGQNQAKSSIKYPVRTVPSISEKGFLLPQQFPNSIIEEVGETNDEDNIISQYILIGVIVCCVLFLITMLSVVWRLYCSSYFDQSIEVPKINKVQKACEADRPLTQLV